MYKNNIRTKKKKELFWIPHAKLITSFLFVATVIFLILMYINEGVKILVSMESKSF